MAHHGRDGGQVRPFIQKKHCEAMPPRVRVQVGHFGADQLLVQLELLVRSQFRRGYIDAEDYALAMDDITHVRRQIAGHKNELARLRRGEVGNGNVRNDG